MTKIGKQHFLILLLLILCCILSPLSADTLPRVPEGYVNDYAGLLSPAEHQSLSSKLRRYEQETTDQLFVVTVNSLEGQRIKTVANTLAQQWKIGQQGKDNGVLVLLSKQEHQVRIEVGYGLEERLTDAYTTHVIHQFMLPAFRQHAFYSGLNAGITALMQPHTKHDDGSGAFILMICIVIGFIIVFICLWVYVAKRGGVTFVNVTGYSTTVTSKAQWDEDSFRGGGGGEFGGGGSDGKW